VKSWVVILQRCQAGVRNYAAWPMSKCPAIQLIHKHEVLYVVATVSLRLEFDHLAWSRRSVRSLINPDQRAANHRSADSEL
jgi:hypothetical protein